MTVKFEVLRVKPLYRHYHGFMSIEANREIHGYDYDLGLYESVYESEIEYDRKDTITLEKIYELLNLNHPMDWIEKKLYSLSVGDIVKLNDDNDRVYYCDDIGWTKINI
jgi:hypothetical protein